MMQQQETKLSGLKVVTSSPRLDSRGSFARIFCLQELSGLIGERKIVQMNHSKNKEKGVVRGVHFQKAPHAEMKLVRCLKGKVWDVAVDLREGSPTQYQWHAEILSGENYKMMVIPEGFAHGFQTIEPDSELLYLHTEYYHPESEGGLHPLSERLGISWPLDITQLSERDMKLERLQ